MPKTYIPISKPSGKTETAREARIQDEIVIDAYDDEEVLSNWYHYLDDTLDFPFEAYFRMENPENLQLYMRVTVLGMADMRFCSARTMWLKVHKEGLKWYFFIPASEIVEADANEQTIQALSDWKYWIR